MKLKTTGFTGCKSEGEGYSLASVCPGLPYSTAGGGVFRGQLRGHKPGLFFDPPSEEGHPSVPDTKQSGDILQYKPIPVYFS